MRSVSTVLAAPRRLTALAAGLTALLLTCGFLLTTQTANAARAEGAAVPGERATANAAPAGSPAVSGEPVVWVSAGGSASCGSEPCRYWVVHWENLGDGAHEVACWAGDTSAQGGPSYWHDLTTHATTWAGSTKYTVRGDSGSAQLPCFTGRSYNGTAIGVKTPDALYSGSTWNI